MSDSEMAVDVAPPEDPGCLASLIGFQMQPGGDRALLTTAYPTNDREPQAVELDEEAQATIAAAGPGKEVKDPLDYAPESHEVCANARFAISTNESARGKIGLQEELKNALYEQAMCKKAEDLPAVNQRVESAKQALETTTQSSELRPDKVTLTFNHTAMEWHFAYYFTNRTGLTASVACELPRLEGTTLANTFVTIDGYADESKYEPIKKAEETFKQLNASANKGACLQAVNKQAYTQTVKIPAWKGGDGPQVPATFSAHFVLSCDDVERKSHLLPKRDGEPTYECSDFAVQPPANDVPFELKIDPESKYGAKLGLPSRAAAKLDAERRGEPTYWLKPTGDEPCRVELTTPAMQPPCLRFRFQSESDNDFDFLSDAIGKAQIQTDQAQAKVLCYAPIGMKGEGGECNKSVALVEVTAPKTLPDLKNAPGKDIHIIWVVDLSASMGMRQNGSSHTNRHLACQEVKLACEKVLGLPKQFVEAGVASPNDTFLVSIVGFACSAIKICERVPVVTDSAKSKAAIDKAVDDLCASTFSGGTQYTSWAQLVKTFCQPTDHVALGLLTDGALWDERTFVPAYDELKKHVVEYTCFAIGCGAWANHRTVKLVATHGETLIETIDRSVSSAAMKGIARCVASMSVKIPIIISGQVLSHKGDRTLPVFRLNSKSPDGVDSVYELGLGEKRIFTVPMASVGDFRMHQGEDGASSRIDVRGASFATNGGTSLIDVKRVLRHLDPLFADADIKTLKNPSHPKRVAELLEAIGVFNQCTTSYVTKVTSYELGTKYDHTLHPGVKAVVPAFKPPNADAEIEWLQQLAAADSAMAKNGKTTYPRKPHYYYENEYPSHWGNCSLGGDDSAPPAFRSLGADPEPMQTEAPVPAAVPAPMPAPVQKAEVEEPTDPNATPKFSFMAKLVHAHNLLKFLNDHTLAHRAVGSVLNELKAMHSNLEKANGAGGKDSDDHSMGDVVEALIDRVAGPSPKDVAAKIDALLRVLCSFVMRYHVPVDVNLYTAPIAEGDVKMLKQRVEYLITIAMRLHTLLLLHRPELWRAELKTESIASDNMTIKTTLEWVAEDNIRPGYDRTHPDPKEVVDNACYNLATAFNEGAYKGGTFCSETMLFSGPKPAAFANKEFKLSAPLVIGTYLDPWKHLREPFKSQLVACM